VEFVSSIKLAFKDAFSPGFTAAKNSLADMRGALDDLGKNQAMNRLAADMAAMTSMTDPMRRALSSALDQPAKIAATLDSAFRNIQVASGASNDEMADMRKELLAIGAHATAGPAAVANAYADIAGGVDDAGKRMAAMNASVALAEANQADLGAASKAMITVMNAWGLSAGGASIAADVMTQASFAGAGSFEEFSSAIGDLSMLSAGAGIGLDELGSTIAYVTTKGMDASRAQKQFKGIISTLLSPSEDLSKLYAAMGIESGQAMLQQYGLADSLRILKDAVGGNEQAFSNLVGSAEAAQAALALTEDAYAGFAGSFADSMGTVTDAARSVQLESIEAKMARLDSASKSVQARIGQDVNNFKGFFAGIKASFLADVVGPLLDTPVGGALSTIAAGAGMLAQGVLDVGGAALNTASQIATVTASVQNAGGLMKMFKTSLGVMKGGLKLLGAPLKLVGSGILGMGKSIIGALPAIGGYISSMWASVAATLAATWPILAIIAGIALLAAGVYLIIKNWDKIAAFFKRLWEGVKAIFTSVWNAIVGFFKKVWTGIKNLIVGFANWFSNIFKTIGNFFKSIWNAIAGFFKGIWDVFKRCINTFTGWLKGIWEGVKSVFVKVWEGISGFFAGIWDGIKSVIGGVFDWISDKINKVIGFVTDAVDAVVGFAEDVLSFFGIIDSREEKAAKAKNIELKDIYFAQECVKAGVSIDKALASGLIQSADVFKGAYAQVLQGIDPLMPHSDAKEGPLSALTASGQALAGTFAGGIQSNAAAPAEAFGSSLEGIARLMPHSDAEEGPLSGLAASGQALTGAFADGARPLPPQRAPLPAPASGSGGASRTAIHVENLYLQAEECQTLFDVLRMIMHAAGQPSRPPV